MQPLTGSIPPTAIPQLSRKIPRKFQRPLTWASMKVDTSRMGTTQVYRRRSGTCIRRLKSVKCPSLEWKDLMKGPSRDAVLARR